jgi:hypothetical protein
MNPSSYALEGEMVEENTKDIMLCFCVNFTESLPMGSSTTDSLFYNHLSAIFSKISQTHIHINPG